MRKLTAFAAGLALGVTTFAASAPAYAQRAYDARFTRPIPLVVLRVGPHRGRSFVPPEEALPGPRRAATFKVTYNGFSKASRRAFQRAVNRWAALLNSSVPITVEANFQNLGDPNILGSAGPSFVHRNFPGAPRQNTWYHDAVANKRSGTDRNPAPDIVANFNSTFPNWHFGEGPAPAGEFDFTTVVMHELGHGLYFSGMGTSNGTIATVQLNGDPGAYDLFTENKAGKRMLQFPDVSTQLHNQLTSNNLFFDSQRVRNANNGKRVKLFAPNPFQGGSSYSHLNENSFPNGNANSLMTPFLSPGETIRSPGPIGKAIAKDAGW
jgi:hypothetical protein